MGRSKPAGEEHSKKIDTGPTGIYFFSWNTLLSVLIACAVSAAGWIALHGIPLMGLPEADAVESVTLVYGGKERKVTGRDDVRLIVQAAGFLNYCLFGEEGGEPEVSVTYHLKAGGDICLEAGPAVVRWKGKAHSLKETDIFTNIIRGVFYES